MSNVQQKIIPYQRTTLISDPFNFLRQEIDRLFEVSSSIEGLRPQFETKENENSIEITAELPGVAEGDINLSLSKGILTISGEKKSEEKKEGETYYITERQYGSFSRSLKLPYEPEQDDIKASFKEGVLKVSVPKPKEMKPDVYKIPIQKS
ncbi:MAG: Hsp20/alpha crystallin family protein [Proteobacteria bacterium]|nr:Hsp20/alpha crystallin family protein [Pseudomonadota bacterium]